MPAAISPRISPRISPAISPAISRILILLAAAFILSGFGSGERLFAPKADLWERWQAHDPQSVGAIDHADWDAFLERAVLVPESGFNRVRYADVTPQERRRLDRYLADMSGVAISSFTRAEQMAYWLNLYNALTVRLILDHYPVETIREIDISPGLFASGPWGADLITIEGEALTLNEIEHRILRPIWNDPRIHYGVNCASIGCPHLLADAFEAATLDAQLTAATRAFVNDARGVRIDGDQIIVSKIYDWFIKDFGGSPAGVLAHLKDYAAPGLRAELERIDTLSGVDYDWSLNGAATQ